MTFRILIFALVLTLFVGAGVGAPVSVTTTGDLVLKTAQAKENKENKIVRKKTIDRRSPNYS